MAVQEQTPYVEYVANGITTSFALGFDCDNRDHLIVLVDDVEPVEGAWSFSNGAVVFNAAPENGKKITIQRNTPFSRTTDYQSYNNSFRPPAVNKDFDWIWWKLQELGVADWILSNRINALKTYVDDRDDELRAYLMEEIRKQGVALDQLDEYYNYLMQRLAQIAVDKGWDASFVVDGNENQHEINSSLIRTVKTTSDLLLIQNPKNKQVIYVESIQKKFIYDADLTVPENGVTVVGKWEMQIQEAYYASWFCPDSSIDNVNEPQTANIEIGYRYATNKRREFIIDQVYYVESTVHNALNSYPPLVGNDSLHYAIRVLSDSVLKFVKGVGKLKLVPNSDTHSRVLCIFDIKNYKIISPWCIGDKDQHLGTTGEQHYMIAFHASKNGYVSDPVCENSWGDGFYFGYPEYVSVFNVDVDYPTDLVIDNANIENSSRNGISLCGAENLTINNPVIDIVDRIAPVSGIDIEPEEDFAYSGKRMHLKNVKIHNLTVKNANNYGVMSFIVGNREIDVSFTGTTTFSAKAPYYCSFPIWHCSYRGDGLTEAQYTASGAINFEKVVMSDAQAQWHIVAPISFHSELGKIKLNIGDLTHTKYQAGPVAFAFDNSSNIIASWSGGLSVGKITLNGVGTVELGQSGATATKNLRDINLPIPEKHEVIFLGRGIQFGDGVNIGGHALVGGSELNENQLINNIVLVPGANPNDGNAIYSQVYVVNKNRKLSYSLVAGLESAAIGQGIRIVNAGAFKVCATKEASITFEISDYPGLKIHGSYGVWTNP